MLALNQGSSNTGVTGIGMGIAGCLGIVGDDEDGSDEDDDSLPEEAVRLEESVDEDDIYDGESDNFTLNYRTG